MQRTKTKRMVRVLKVLRSLRQSEEARLGILKRRSLALKSAQTSAIATFNDQYEQGTPQTAGFARLLADRMRSSAAQEQVTEEQAERHSEMLARRRGHEKVTERFVDELNEADLRDVEAVQLQDVIDVYRGKPAASKP